MEKAGVDLVANGAAAFNAAMGSAQGAVERFGSATGGAGRVTSAFASIVDGAYKRIGQIVVDTLIAAGQKIAQFGADSIQVAADFESGMNRFGAVTALSGEQLGDFSDLFLKLGKDTQYSAAQAQEAAINLAKGGIDPAVISAGALADTLTLASAGELELAAAAEITAKALGVWGNAGVDSAEVANLMAQAANASTVGVEDLAMGLYQAQGTAKLAGLSFEETVTALAQLAPGFGSASDAGTSFKVFLSRLQPATDSASAAMRKLGLLTAEGSSVFYDAQGNFVGMSKAAELLQNATSGLSEAQRIQALQTIFGQDAIRAAGMLAEGGAEAFDGMAASMTAAGSAAEQAKKRQKGFNFAMDQFKGSLETLQIIIGTAVLPLLTKLFDTVITPAVNTVIDLSTALFGGGDAIDNLQAMFAATNPDLAKFIGLIGGIIDNFKAGFESGGLAGAVQKGFASLVFVAQQELDKLFGGANIGASLGNAFLDLLPQVTTALGTLFTGAAEWLSANLPTILNAWGDFVRFISSWILAALPGALESIGSLVRSMADAVIMNLPAWIAAFAQFAIEMVSWIAEQLPSLIDNLGSFLNGMINWVVDSIPKWAANLAMFAEKIAGWVLDALPGLAANLGLAAGKLIGWILQTIIDITPKLLEMAAKFIDWVATAVIPNLPAALDTIFKALVTFIQTAAREIVPKLNELGEKFVSWITDPDGPVHNIGRSLEKLNEKIEEWRQQIIKDVQTKIKEVGKAMIDGLSKAISDGASAVANALSSVVNGAIDSIKRTLGIQSPSKVAAELIGVPFVEGIAEGIMRGSGSVLSAMNAAMAGTYRPPATASQMMSTYNNSTTIAPQYNLSVNTLQSTGSVVNDFALMAASSV